MDREVIKLTNEELEDFDFTGGSKWSLRNETYNYIETLRTDQFSDGASWDTIVQRESDKKFFKWGCWDTSRDYQMEYGENCMKEVFQTVISKTIYE